MDQCVAVRADRNQVRYRVNYVRAANRGQRDNVMHMNEPSAECTVGTLEIEATYRTGIAVVSQALGPGASTTLVRIDANRYCRALDKFFGLTWEFLRDLRRYFVASAIPLRSGANEALCGQFRNK